MTLSAKDFAHAITPTVDGSQRVVSAIRQANPSPNRVDGGMVSRTRRSFGRRPGPGP
jgi:hypothetical protein